jgi:microcystin-dependent protein
VGVSVDYYLGQIGIYGFNFAPYGWALCDGSVLPISQNTALYSLIGSTYGGDGQATFALPDLRSRTPVAVGPQTQMGEMAGTETVTLIVSDMPSHNHLMAVNDAAATAKIIAGNVFAQGTDGKTAVPAYLPPQGNLTLNPLTVSLTGGNAAHPNIQPCLAVNFCIATTGYYPARN